MKKKALELLIVLSACFILAGCGGDANVDVPIEAGDISPVPSATSTGGVEVDDGLLSVDITLPASMFDGQDMSAFDPDAYAEKQGFQKAVLNEDGSIVVTMSKTKHKELLEQMAAQYNDTFSAMVGAEDTLYIKSIAHTDNFSEIIVEVDRAAYEAENFDLTPFTLGMSGMMYQVFSGDELHVEVIIKDSATGDVITSSIYPDDIDG